MVAMLQHAIMHVELAYCHMLGVVSVVPVRLTLSCHMSSSTMSSFHRNYISIPSVFRAAPT